MFSLGMLLEPMSGPVTNCHLGGNSRAALPVDTLYFTGKCDARRKEAVGKSVGNRRIFPLFAA
jgi:hypothetical protein